MLPNSGVNQSAFYEISATLIPILVFGGVFVNRGGPEPFEADRAVNRSAIWIPILGAFAVAAEMLAISGLVIGPLPSGLVAFIAAVLTGALVGVIWYAWSPWMREAERRRFYGSKHLRLASSILLILAFVGTVLLLISLVRNASDTETYAEYLARLRNCERNELSVVRETRQSFESTDLPRRRVLTDGRELARTIERLKIAKIESRPQGVVMAIQATIKSEKALLEFDIMEEGNANHQTDDAPKNLEDAFCFGTQQAEP